MNLNEYRNNAKVTMADLGSNILNSVHMSLGVVSEVNDELFEAIIAQNDKVNIGEEIADANWYLANYANIWDIETPDTFVNTYYSSIVDYHQLLIAIGKLVDLDKKELAYGKIADVATRSMYLMNIWSFLDLMAEDFELKPEKLRATNIEKLKARYGDKFDSAKAIDRDLDKEREILESGT